MSSDADPAPVSMAQAFAFCPACGTANASPGSVPFVCSGCEFRYFFNPVAAVGGLIVNDDGELLLVRRARDPGRGMWGLPGGFVDGGESIAQALAREVYEETRLRVADSELLLTAPNDYLYRGISIDVVDLFFIVRVRRTSPIRLADGELTEYRWCVPSEGDVRKMAFASNRKAVRRWLKQRS